MDKPVNDMTLDECRDELAIRKGWIPPNTLIDHPPSAPHRGPRLPSWTIVQDGELVSNGCEDLGDNVPDLGPAIHPIRLTIDAIAAEMPTGWTWILSSREGKKFVVSAFSTRAEIKPFDADTEILARARLAVSCWRAQKGANPNV